MTLIELRKEFPLGSLSSASLYANIVVVSIRIAHNKLIGTVLTELCKDGRLVVTEINLVIDQNGSQPLLAIAKREGIKYEILTKSLLKQIADSPY